MVANLASWLAEGGYDDQVDALIMILDRMVRRRWDRPYSGCPGLPMTASDLGL